MVQLTCHKSLQNMCVSLLTPSARILLQPMGSRLPVTRQVGAEPCSCNQGSTVGDDGVLERQKRKAGKCATAPFQPSSYLELAKQLRHSRQHLDAFCCVAGMLRKVINHGLFNLRQTLHRLQPPKTQPQEVDLATMSAFARPETLCCVLPFMWLCNCA